MVDTSLNTDGVALQGEPDADGLEPSADELADERPEPDSRTSPDQPAAS
jgi:hypothetical protein